MKRRSRRGAQDRELDRPISVAPNGSNGNSRHGQRPSDELVGQGFVTAGICAECRGPLFAGDRHYHERAARTYVGAEPVCCVCKGLAVGHQ